MWLSTCVVLCLSLLYTSADSYESSLARQNFKANIVEQFFFQIYPTEAEDTCLGEAVVAGGEEEDGREVVVEGEVETGGVVDVVEVEAEAGKAVEESEVEAGELEVGAGVEEEGVRVLSTVTASARPV